MTDNTQVIITWMTKHDDESICSLAWNNGAGPTRVYSKDQYDSRLDLGRDRAKDGPLPYFKNHREALAWMFANRGEQCQVDVIAGHRLGLI